MPELPEVETVCRGLIPHVIGKTIQQVTVRQRQLRWKISENLETQIVEKTIRRLSRRGKYILLHLETNTLLIHLGMSGRLCIFTENQPPQRHDHVDIIFSDGNILRYTDPRRFGAMLISAGTETHPLLNKLGIEPLSEKFTADYLYHHLNQKKAAIKSFIMSGKVVVGVGNIYAAEALFLARIHPQKPAGLLTKADAERLVITIKHILTLAIQQGGTTLKDFVNSEGKPGYFSQQLNVYGRAGQACFQCNTLLENIVLGQRSTVFCPQCQP